MKALPKHTRQQPHCPPPLLTKRGTSWAAAVAQVDPTHHASRADLGHSCFEVGVATPKQWMSEWVWVQDKTPAFWN